ncbi:MAG TPA: VTT domain-containing protein [Vicinamibacterales bacterium]|nr:VTT domain-containing protein [Vicinamibacterales bacterium]
MELWGLLVSSFLAATVLPLASEVPLALIVRRHGDILIPVLVATLGNFLGACTTYGLARAAAATLAPQTLNQPSRALRLFERYGAPALLLTWVPIVGDAIVVLAGVSRIPLVAFSAWTVAGKAARYAAVAWIALHV